MSFEYMTKEGCGSGVFLFRPLLALAALWSSTQMQLRRCLKCGWGIVPEILHLSLPLLSLPMFCCFNVSSGIRSTIFISSEVRLSFLCFVRLAIVAVHHSTRSCRHFRARVCSVQRCEAQRDALDNDTESDDGVLRGLQVMAHLA